MATSTSWKPDDAKAMYGAVFVETVIYCMFYLTMHIKDHESDLLSRKRNAKELAANKEEAKKNGIEENKKEQEELEQEPLDPAKVGDQEKKIEENLPGDLPRPVLDYDDINDAKYRIRLD